ncbi:MAG: hypothetical protein LBT38_02185 [Deltaproteobacteria bacterium]|jgi:hypothetical protein|nr:hypothetical protein [Deltaproteobacteria bacterium]
MPLSKLDPQGYSNAMTYAHRYSMAAMIGLIVEDDDAESACGRPKGYDSKNESIPSLPEKLSASCHDYLTDKVILNDLDLLANFPKLDGINYQAVKANDGQSCIVATGDTISKKIFSQRTALNGTLTERSGGVTLRPPDSFPYFSTYQLNLSQDAFFRRLGMEVI